MGDCIYCGKSAGFLKKEHRECKGLFEKENRRKKNLLEKGNREMVALVSSTIIEGEPLNSLEQELRSIAESHSINSSDIKGYLIKGWEEAIGTALEDGVLTKEEESRLADIRERFSLSQADLDKNGAYTKLVQASVLREILEGNIPARVKVEGTLPFNLQKAEQLVCVFQDVQYYEQKTRREYVGGSVGSSVRVAKGFYLRASSFKGHPVDRTDTVHIDAGILGVTNKHIYFTGKVKSPRIPYSKVVSFQPYSDGIVIQRDVASAKPQTFVTDHGWFSYNLITNLAKM